VQFTDPPAEEIRQELRPADVVGNPFGSIVSPPLRGVRKSRCPRAAAAWDADHDPVRAPPLHEVNRRVAAVVELLQSGEEEADAKRFVETVAWHPAAWDASEMREVFVCNAPTFLGEAHDRDWQRIDVEQPSRFEPPALLTKGTVSPPFFAALVDTIGGRRRSSGSKRSRARITRRTRPPPTGTSR
jgi:hypothetical protein